MIDRRTLPLSSLRAFESTAQHLHMGKAGQELGVTHGAVSHQVRQLEERLGIKLFSRAHNSLALTPAGARLLQAVTEGFDRILDGTRYLDPENLSGPLIIGCTQTIASSWAAKHICEFFQKYPTISVTVREIVSRQSDVPRDIDVAICYGAPNEDDRKLTALGTPKLYPVCSPKLLQRQKTGRHRPVDVTSHTLIHDSQASWANWMTKHDVNADRAESNIYFPNTSQALRAAILGAGIALSNTLETQEYIKDGQLVRILNNSIDEAHSYYLLSPSDENETTKTRIFEEWIINACDPL